MRCCTSPQSRRLDQEERTLNYKYWHGQIMNYLLHLWSQAILIVSAAPFRDNMVVLWIMNKNTFVVLDPTVHPGHLRKGGIKRPQFSDSFQFILIVFVIVCCCCPPQCSWYLYSGLRPRSKQHPHPWADNARPVLCETLPMKPWTCGVAGAPLVFETTPFGMERDVSFVMK